MLILLYIFFLLNSVCYKKQISIHIPVCKLGNALNATEVQCMSLNANEEMLAGYADPDASYPDADPDGT